MSFDLSSEDINVRLQELGSRGHDTTAGAGKDLVSSLVSVTMFYTRLKDHSTMPYICALSQTVNDSRVFLGRRWDGQRWSKKKEKGGDLRRRLPSLLTDVTRSISIDDGHLTMSNDNQQQ
ncbi:hypothetical protein F2Q69_00029937 [Brassica cretica]|uniref:Uncharacterized protein n=1 Tax=Brassica cretica TaxID=69181 RepID=A0A8S9S6D9_BRACR|nr:hypothetical protein F2Q69_00029937 [Brassica cretica]